MNEWVTHQDGSIEFPLRVVCPKEVIYYNRDKHNHRLFHPAFLPCKFRSKAVEKKRCGRLAVCWFCEKKQQAVNVARCEDCEVREE